MKGEKPNMKKAKLNPNLKEQKQINNELRFEKKIDLKKKKTRSENWFGLWCF